MCAVKRFRVTITVGVLALSEQTAWEYGNALASKDPRGISAGCKEDPDAEDSQVEVEDVECPRSSWC